MSDGGPTLVRLVQAAALFAAVGVGIAHLIDFGVYDLRVAAWNSLTHRSVPGVASLAALAVAAAAAGWLALSTRAARRHWALLAGVLAVLLALRVTYPPHVLVIALPFTVAAFCLMWTSGSGETQRLLRDGCVVLVAAFVLHAIGTSLVSALGYGADSWPYQIKAVLKHSGELGGWTLVAGALVGQAVRRRPAIDVAHAARQSMSRAA